MNLFWYGQSCFKLQGEDMAILIDPFTPQEVGLRNPRFGFHLDLVLFSRQKMIIPAEKKDFFEKVFLISSPGEYELKNTFIYGLPHFENGEATIIYRLEFKGIKIVFLGQIAKLLSEKEIEEISNDLDYLIIPIGGKNVLETEKACTIITQLEPKTVIPSCYQTINVKSNLERIENFVHALGLKKPETLDKLKIQKIEPGQKEIKVFILKIS